MNVDIAEALIEQGYAEAGDLILIWWRCSFPTSSGYLNFHCCSHFSTEASVQEAIKSCSTLEEAGALAWAMLSQNVVEST